MASGSSAALCAGLTALLLNGCDRTRRGQQQAMRMINDLKRLLGRDWKDPNDSMQSDAKYMGMAKGAQSTMLWQGVADE